MQRNRIPAAEPPTPPTPDVADERARQAQYEPEPDVTPAARENHAVTGPVAENYAQALFELAEQEGEGEGSLEATSEELAQVVRLVRHEPGLKALFDHKTISPERRSASLERIFRDRISNLLLRFLHVLNQHKRLDALQAIHSVFQNRLKERAGEVDVELHTATQLDSETLENVAQKIGRAIGRKAIVRPQVDESLIGGLKLRLGDRVIDGSVARQLEKIRAELVAKGREAGRGGEKG